MQMVNGLHRVLAAVAHNAVSPVEAELLRRLCYHGKYMPDYSFIFGIHTCRVLDMLLWYHKVMRRCLRLDIVKSQHLVVFIDLA